MNVNIGKGIEMVVDANALPANAMAHVVMIGLRNILMDSHASVTADEYPNEAERVAASRAMAEKKLEALMRGEVRVQSTREGDPVKAEAIRIATDRIKTALRKAGRKLADVDAKAIREKAVAMIAADPAIVELAKRRVDEARGAAVDEDVLAGL